MDFEKYSNATTLDNYVFFHPKVDVDLAKSCADLPEDDEELRKKLWLKIARHVVQEEKDVKKAMNCLSSCDLLKIEDILPFFPDFVTIDHFKVCNRVVTLMCFKDSELCTSCRSIPCFLRRPSAAPWRSTTSTSRS